MLTCLKEGNMINQILILFVFNSHGLKAVTRAKLGYEPIEVDPELMVPLARKNT